MFEQESINSYDQGESSFAERYMAESTAPAKRNDPGRRGAAPAVTVSIPYGEESGGLLSGIRKLLGRKTPSMPDPESMQWTESPIYEPASGEDSLSEDEASEESISENADEETADTTPTAPAAGARNGDGAIGENHALLMALSEDVMAANKRSFAGFSIKDGAFASVRSSIGMLQKMLSLSYPASDPGKLRTEATAIMDQYSAVLGALRGYVSHITEKGGSRTSSGKARLDLVSQLIPLYEKDFRYFGVVAGSLASDDASGIKSWDDVLYNARAEDLSRDNAQLETVGTGASVITKRTTSDGKSEFVKMEEKSVSKDEDERFVGDEVVQMYRNIGGTSTEILEEILSYFREHPIEGEGGNIPAERSVADFCSYILNEGRVAESKAVRKKGMSDEEYKAANRVYVRGLIKNHGIYKETDFKDFLDHMMATDDGLDKLMDFLGFTNKKSVESDAVNYSGIKYGSTISDRNVSTSILAERLGMSDMIASSHTVLVQNQKGETVRANSMEGAEGKDLAGWRKEAEALEEEDKKQHEENKADGPPLKIVFSYTPKALMQLNDLVVLDLISGQGDRNAGNYFFTVEKSEKDQSGKAVWFLTSVKGIDNDMSFGEFGFERIAERGGIGKARKIIRKAKYGGEEDEQDSYYMSKSVYNRIMSYHPEMAAMDQRHLRSDEEIKALQSRLEGMKKELNAMVDGGKLILAENEEQMRQGYQKTMEKRPEWFGSTYYNKKILSSEGLNYGMAPE